MEYKVFYNDAKQIDSMIGYYFKSTKASVLPFNDFIIIIHKKFPSFYLIGKGTHKISFKVDDGKKLLVLKVGKKETIENDHRAYKLLPKRVRRKYFAKIFWHTKYCLLQEYGKDAVATSKQVENIRELMGRYGLIDIRCENIKMIDGELKVIDANIARGRSAPLMKIIDYVKVRLPWN